MRELSLVQIQDGWHPGSCSRDGVSFHQPNNCGQSEERVGQINHPPRHSASAAPRTNHYVALLFAHRDSEICSLKLVSLRNHEFGFFLSETHNSLKFCIHALSSTVVTKLYTGPVNIKFKRPVEFVCAFRFKQEHKFRS